MSALHIPVGGARFRPCLEDVVQLLAEDFRFDMLPTWRAAVNPGREEWRRKQVRAAVRDWQEEAAETLRKLGYSVTAPEEVHQPADVARFGW